MRHLYEQSRFDSFHVPLNLRKKRMYWLTQSKIPNWKKGTSISTLLPSSESLL